MKRIGLNLVVAAAVLAAAPGALAGTVSRHGDRFVVKAVAGEDNWYQPSHIERDPYYCPRARHGCLAFHDLNPNPLTDGPGCFIVAATPSIVRCKDPGGSVKVVIKAGDQDDRIAGTHFAEARPNDTSSRILLGAGNDGAALGPGDDQIYGGPGNESFAGGGSGLSGYGGDDYVDGGRGTTASTAGRGTIASAAASPTSGSTRCSAGRASMRSTPATASPTGPWTAAPATTRTPAGMPGSTRRRRAVSSAPGSWTSARGAVGSGHVRDDAGSGLVDRRRIGSVAVLVTVCAQLAMASPSSAGEEILGAASYPDMSTYKCKTDPLPISPGQNLNLVAATTTCPHAKKISGPGSASTFDPGSGAQGYVTRFQPSMQEIKNSGKLVTPSVWDLHLHHVVWLRGGGGADLCLRRGEDRP